MTGSSPRGSESSLADGTKAYLEYLDKEMTIIGVLSGFTVAAASLVLERTLTASPGTALANLWSVGRPYLLGGSLLLFIAALYFYGQRSLLAWHYGQIALSATGAAYPDLTTTGLLKEADSWATWTRYSIAFDFLTGGFLSLGLVFSAGQPSQRTIWGIPLALGILLLLCVAVALLQHYVFTKYPFEDRPWRRFAIATLRCKASFG